MTDDLLEHVVHEHDPDGSHLGLGDSSSISTTLTNEHSTVRACSTEQAISCDMPFSKLTPPLCVEFREIAASATAS
ncbi:hypothetical protein RvY_00002 [Ramazzottius varieornatus]|uniref:Uncharacterized protein n=1 Tax=Ramazzottius varieornatus TaxID=947166 RepID=A0A1D1UB15_RAMVA|nr:hypothetical protein RvY_00002 [Ramazzottius varieornatus]